MSSGRRPMSFHALRSLRNRIFSRQGLGPIPHSGLWLEGCAVHGIEAFFSDEFPTSPVGSGTVCGRSMLDQGSPQFQRAL